MEVFYELLACQSEQEIRRGCEFCGRTYSERTRESSMYMIKAHVSCGVKGIIDNSGKWREYFDEATRVELERIAGRTLEAYGYAVGNSQGDAEVSPFRLRLWRLRDWVSLTLGFFRLRGWRGLPTFFRVVKAALLQGSTRKV